MSSAFRQSLLIITCVILASSFTFPSYAMGPDEAAIKIQKAYRAYKRRQDEKRFLHNYKATLPGYQGSQTLENRLAIKEYKNPFLQLPFNVIVASTRASLIERDLMPLFLDESTKNIAFQRSISRAKGLLDKHEDEASIALLNCFETEKNPISTDECNETLRDLISDYLFESVGQYKTPYAAKINPMAEWFLEIHPNAILRKDMDYESFESVVKLGRIGRLKSELGMTVGEFDELSAAYLNSRLFVSGSFLEMIPDRFQSKTQDHIFRENSLTGNGVRIIFKPTLLKRLDYHLSSGWPGGLFVDGTSFTPYELNQFYAQASSSKGGEFGGRTFQNEIIFRHPISFEDIQIVMVRPHNVKAVRKLLKSHGYNHITVESIGESPLRSSDTCETQKISNPPVNPYEYLSDLITFVEQHTNLEEVHSLSRQFQTQADPTFRHFHRLIQLQSEASGK